MTPTDNRTVQHTDGCARFLCPRWCIGGHDDPEVALSEADDGFVTHYSSSNMGLFLGDVLNPVSKRVMRSASGSLSLVVSMEEATGQRQEPTVDLKVHSHGDDVSERVREFQMMTTRLTSGEARSLAAMLLRCADLIDLEG